MINSILLLTSLQTPTIPRAIVVADAFIAKSSPLMMQYTISESGVTVKGHCSFGIEKPNSQWFTCDWRGESVEFRQKNAHAVLIRHDWKSYEEYNSGAVSTPPPTKFLGLAEIATPPFGYSESLKKFAGNKAWTSKGFEKIGGVDCDVVTIQIPGQIGNGMHTAWIDSTGRIKQWRRQFSNPADSFDIVFEFQSYESGDLKGRAHFDPDLPLGYVPARLPLPFYHTLRVDDNAVFGKWLDARTNTRIDVAKKVKGEHIAIVFTDPDSEICRTIEPFLVSLRKQLKSKNCSLIEVVLSNVAPNTNRVDKDRTIIWDKDGQIEKSYGPPGTPYFLMSDEKGVLVRGWQGYRKSDDAKIIANFISAFKK